MSYRKLRTRCGLDQTLVVNRPGNAKHVIERQCTDEYARKLHNRKAPHCPAAAMRGTVGVKVVGNDRKLMYADVVVRISPAYRLKLHLDADEGNAAGLSAGEDLVGRD